MPPLRGIDRGLNGNALKALEEAGHGQRIAIVDPSYNFPVNAQVLDYVGPPHTSAALRGILKLIPIEGDVVLMAPDPGSDDRKALDKMQEELNRLEIGHGVIPRLDEHAEDGNGFYSVVNNPESSTIFFRTRDVRTFACATFIVGHAQIHDEDPGRNIDMGNY